ncbi:hypothetical protein IFT48_00130 [Pseudomonas fluorescens]|uniref:hypothetical protein n=1 Tax=Pseudomonas TaxID=286 RepID=UPI000F01CFCA|nr:MULTISPECIES: hypothetical protein [Pseudomonas]MBD8088399.1 hypothetical protein [Pseudomonas fluorescens]MBD8615155.1 hypothetical protein [Pseudomonas putida]MBD8681170.1 hypothetical protein [Pseudomonas sp. CFBP 13719]
MLDSLKEIGSFNSLPMAEQKRLLSVLSSHVLTDFDVDQILMTIASHGQWNCLKSVMRQPGIRRRLAHVISLMQDQAASRQESIEFAQALPKRLDSESALVALHFPIQIKSWAIAKQLIDRGAYLSPQHFRALCDRYTAGDGEFDRKLIVCLMSREIVDWPKALGFHSMDGWQALITRASSSEDPALYLCASCLMNIRQKKAVIKQAQSRAMVLMAIKHMHLTGKWQDAIPDAYRDDVLGCQLGL